LFWSFDDIPGWRGFSDVGFTLTESQNNNDGSGTSSDRGTGGDGGGSDVTSIQDGTSRNASDDGVKPGAFVAAGVAALILIILAIFIIQRRNNKHLEQVNESMKHVQMTDDEEDENIAAHERSMEKERLSLVNDDHDIISVVDNSQFYDNGGGSDGEGTEVLALNPTRSRESGSLAARPYQPPTIEEERDPPSVMIRNMSQDASSLDESSYYRYPSRRILTHRIDSYSNEVKEDSNNRAYRITQDTVTL
jgi:hypothetical protein